MAKAGGNSAILASSSMLVPDHERASQEIAPPEAPQMLHIPGQGFVAVDDLQDEKEADEIQFQPVMINATADDFVEPMGSDEIAQLTALGMLDDEAPEASDTAIVDAIHGAPAPVQYDTGPIVDTDLPAYVGTPPPPEKPDDTRWRDADTQDALARTPDTDTDRRGSAGGWCAEGEIQIQGQCVNIAQLLGGLAENKQNLKELVKEEIKQLIISKNLDLKGNK